MRKRLVRKTTVVFGSSLLLTVLVTPAFADIYVPRGNNYPAGTEGTLVWQGNGYTIQGGDLFVLSASTDPDLYHYVDTGFNQDWFKWFYDGRILRDSSTGQQIGSGGIFL